MLTSVGFLVLSVVLILLELKFGLAYLLVGAAIVSFAVGCGLALGLDSGTILPFAEILATLVFTPILIRLWFLSRASGLGRNGGTVRNDAPGSVTRAHGLLAGMEVTASVLSLFTFFFAQAVLVILLATAIWAEQVPTQAHFAGIPAASAYLVSWVANRYTKSGIARIVWAALGLFVIGSLLLFGALWARMLLLGAA